VYSTAERNAAVDQELGSVSLEQELIQQVKATIGRDLVGAGGFTFLYHRNSALSQQVWRNTVDRLTAANLLLNSKIAGAKGNISGEKKLQEQVESMLGDLLQFGKAPPYMEP
jgi:hypothetical protein